MYGLINTRLPILLPLAMLLVMLSAPVSAAAPKQEPAISIEITGDKEVPLVLYIVPWQNPEAPIPDPPELDDPSLRPLLPCQVDDAIPAQEVAAWLCEPDQNKP